jgi:hypothetical protein
MVDRGGRFAASGKPQQDTGKQKKCTTLLFKKKSQARYYKYLVIIPMIELLRRSDQLS